MNGPQDAGSGSGTAATPQATAGDELAPTDRTRLTRKKERGSASRADLNAVLADGFVCHLGVVIDGAPRVVPTVYGATADTLYFHGSVAAVSLLRAPHTTVCVTVTHVDGVVLARSVFDHSANYRSAMIYGVPRRVLDEEEKRFGLRVVTEQAAPGQWNYARPPNRKELAATTLLALPLDEASVKVRTGPAGDTPEDDAAAARWAGVVPLRTVRGAPVPAPDVPGSVELPPHLRDGRLAT